MVGTVYYPTTPPEISLPSQLPLHRQLGDKHVQWTLQQERHLRQILPPIQPNCLFTGGAGRILQAASQAGLSANPNSPEKEESQHDLQAASCSVASHAAIFAAADQNPTKRISLYSLQTLKKHSNIGLWYLQLIRFQQSTFHYITDVKQRQQQRPMTPTVTPFHLACEWVTGTQAKGRTSVGVYLLTIYSHARW